MDKINFSELNLLLNQINTVLVKEAEKKRFLKQNFNVFSLLRKEHDEKNLHSKFISELLNPKGSHEMGSLYLEIFCDMFCKNKKSVRNKELVFCLDDLQNYTIKREKKIGSVQNNLDRPVGGDIDLYLKSKDQQIVIENKIYAEDQLYQLLRYYNFLNENGESLLFYLTLYGDEPSDKSIKKEGYQELKLGTDFYCLSYKDDIHQWLEKCYRESIEYPVLRETLKQYLNLINNLTGGNMDENTEVVNAIIKNGKFQEIDQLSKIWEPLKKDSEFYFWEDLEEALGNKYGKNKIFDFQKYDYNKVHKSRQCFYGIMLEVQQLSDSLALYLYVELSDDRILYGLTLIEKGLRTINGDPSKYTLLNSLEQIELNSDEYLPNDWWVGVKYFKRRLDFNNYATPESYNIVDPELRTKYIEEIVTEIHEYLKVCGIFTT